MTHVKRNDIEIHTFSELMGAEFSPMEWLVKELIPTSSVVAISGYPASYKTWLVLDLALKVAEGKPLFGKFPTEKTGVLLIDEENGARLLQKRFKFLKADNPSLPLFWTSLNEFKLTEETVDYLISSAVERGVRLVIFDSLVRIHSNDENSSGEMAKISTLLKRFVKKDIAVIFTHHNRKTLSGKVNHAQDMRGSSEILASPEVHIALQRKGRERVVDVVQTKLRDGEEQKPFRLELVSDKQSCYFKFCGFIQPNADKVKDGVREVLGEFSSLYGTDLFKKLKGSGVKLGTSTFSKVVKEMVADGELVESKGSGSGILYSLA